MARSRLRSAFQYPDEADDLPPHMDEEEQEALLAALRATDSSTNELYSTLFSLLFVLPAIHSIFLFLAAPSLLKVLCTSSFMLTIYAVKCIPVPPSAGEGGSEHRPVEFAVEGGWGGPIDRLLPILNGVLAAVVGWGTFVENSRGGAGSRLRGGRGLTLEGWAGYLPIVVYILSMIVRYAMKPLDLGELERMKYKYKGA